MYGYCQLLRSFLYKDNFTIVHAKALESYTTLVSW